jgi:hypothetical protein
MIDQDIDRIARAVLYEGYLLYPYRLSVKNVRRWTFGGLYPRSHHEATGEAMPFRMRTEVLLTGEWSTRVRARVRFLQVQDRTVGRRPAPGEGPEAQDGAFPRVPSLEVSGTRHVPWQEGVERQVLVGPFALEGLEAGVQPIVLRAPGERYRQLLRGSGGSVEGDLLRETKALFGEADLSARRIAPGVFRLRVEVSNQTRMADPGDAQEAELRGFMATHVVLEVEGGRFFSMTDPPGPLAQAAGACRQIGSWPVLVGDPEDPRAVLGSPIILPDYPRPAPESPGDLYDLTEIDEILSLRIRTLGEEERQSVLELDPRGRELLERTERLDRERLEALHGRWRRIPGDSRDP